MSSNAAHWPRMAASWRLVGPPLRPGPGDLALFNDTVARWSARNAAAPGALILGVTPELYHLHWPAGTTLTALDASPEMIASVWPGKKSTALAGSWTAAPLADGSQDIILLDGGFGVLDYPHAQRGLLEEVCRLLAPSGVFAVRLFAPAGRTGSLAEIGADLRAGLIETLDGLKLRVWGALHKNLAEGVSPRDVVAQIESLAGEPGWLSTELGWSAQHLDTLELHRHSQATYHLVDAEEMLRMAADVQGLAPESVAYPEHAYGACCPLVTLRRC